MSAGEKNGEYIEDEELKSIHVCDLFHRVALDYYKTIIRNQVRQQIHPSSD